MAKRKHGRQLSRNEIIQKMKKVSDMRRSAETSPFTGVAILANHVLWKKDGWGQIKLTRYNQIVNDYENKINAGEVEVETLSDRLWNKAEFRLEYVPFESCHGSSLRDRFDNEVIEFNNRIHLLATRHLTVHFNALMDLGYGKKRLERNKDWLNEYLRESEKGTFNIMDLHRELVDGVGIYIEIVHG